MKMAHAIQIEKIRGHRVERMSAKLKSYRLALRAANVQLDEQAADIAIHEARLVALKQDICTGGTIKAGAILEKLNGVSKQSETIAALLTHKNELASKALGIEKNIERSSVDVKRVLNSNEKWKLVLQHMKNASCSIEP